MWLKTYLTCGFACSEYPASVLRNSGLRRCGSKIHLTCGSRSSSRCQRQCTISNEHGNDKAACEKHSLQSKAMQGTRVAVFFDTMFCMKSQQESRLACEVPCGPAKQKQKRIDIDRFPGTSWYWQYQDVISCSSTSSCEHNTHTIYTPTEAAVQLHRPNGEATRQSQLGTFALERTIQLHHAHVYL